jgi:putative ABC transport system ATP-binding protein
MSKPIVELQGVTRVYRQGDVEVKALRGLDLQVFPGEFTAICGPSGSGKTTALNLIGALDKPTSGNVLVDGTNISELNQRQRSHLRRDRIGFVFQAYNLIPVLTAFENAEAVLSLQGKNKAKKEEVMKLLKDVGLEGMEHRRPHEMSGGQQQRVAIARAIAAEPAVVLADEPTANVDSKTAETLLDLMGQLNRERGITFLFSTHDPRVMAHARRIITLVDGKVSDDREKAAGEAHEVEHIVPVTAGVAG